MAVGAKRQTLDQLLDAACARIRRYGPAEAFAAVENGAVLIDIRSDVDRGRDGIVPGSLHIPRTVAMPAAGTRGWMKMVCAAG
jgi:hypothetical protein